jgi:hypothetical protein
MNTETSIAAIASAYEKATADFLRIVAGLEESDLDKNDGEGWTPRQVVHHLADSEAQSYARLRRLVAEPGTIIQGYDEGKWAESETLGYKELPIELSLAVFRAVRASSLMILRRLTPDQLNNTGEHTESGTITIHTWINSYTNHPVDHGQQITKAISQL